MRKPISARLIAVYVVGIVALVAVACASDTSSDSGGSTNPPLTDKQEKKAKKKPAAQKTLSFSGNGLKNLGTLKITSESILRWTNDGDLTTVMTDSDPLVLVNSQGRSGETVLNAGTYKNVQVNALGNWTIKIKAR